MPGCLKSPGSPSRPKHSTATARINFRPQSHERRTIEGSVAVSARFAMKSCAKPPASSRSASSFLTCRRRGAVHIGTGPSTTNGCAFAVTMPHAEWKNLQFELCASLSRMETSEVGGRTCHLLDSGTGDAVIALHGLGSMAQELEHRLAREAS